MRRRRWLLATLGGTIAVAGTIGVVAVSAGSGDGGPTATSSASGFHPRILKGKWTGEWKNTTFGSKGDILANVKVKGKKFKPMLDLSGDVFGCADPDEDAVTLKKGRGANRWNGKGFTIKGESNALGDMKLKYKHATGKVKGSGNSSCDPNTTWELEGKLTKKKFDADVDIDLGAGQMAKSTADAKKR